MSATGWAGDIMAGRTVLDLSSNLAGPLAAMVLGDMGADVIKVERTGTGDDTRSLHPSWRGDSTVFLSVNRGKRSVELDLASAEGRGALLRLSESADVLIESFGPGVAEKLGVDFDAVAEHNPQIIYGTVSAFGSGAVGSRLPGYDSLIQGFSGMMSITGHPEAPPTRVAPSAIDLSTGLWLVIAILVALQRRDVQDGPQHLETALIDSAFNLMGHQVLGMLATGEVPGPLGSGSPSTMPNGAFQAADGWIVVATGNESQWRRLCAALEATELLDDPRYATLTDRIASRNSLQAELDDRFRSRDVAHWVQRLSDARVPVGRLNDLSEAIEHPLFAERRLLVAPGAEEDEQLPQLRLPIDLHGGGVRSPPPRLGQHTAEVLREAGFDEDSIELLGSSAPSTIR